MIVHCRTGSLENNAARQSEHVLFTAAQAA